ncbi:MAG: hypothetical protein WCY12_05945, partial [Candidatus Omnitrophota bacterium]
MISFRMLSRTIGKVAVLTMVMAGLMLFKSSLSITQNSAYGDSPNTFTQTDWSGGSSATTAAHPSDQTGWTRYVSKDNNIDTTYPGRMLYSKASRQIVDDADTDFTGTRTKLNLTGTGAPAKLELDATISDPFYDSLSNWSNLPHFASMGYNSDAIQVGNYIYSIWSSWTTQFMRWDVANKKWEAFANPPFTVSDGYYMSSTALAYPGAGDYIYCLRGTATKDFYRYSISDDKWEKMADFPESINSRGSICGKGGVSGYIYGIGSPNTLYQYSIATDEWTQKANCTWSYDESAVLAYSGTGNDIYVSGAGTIYIDSTRYSRTAKYNTSTNQWTYITNMPFNLGYGGHQFVYPGTGDYIYATDSYSSWGFARFSISGQTWETLTNAPLLNYWGKGTFYIENNKLCYLKGHNYGRPFTFDLTTLIWDEPCSPPVLSNQEGDRYTYDSDAGIIYATPGNGDYRYFYKYTVAQNKWERLSSANVPFNTYRGTSMVYYKNYVYLLAGNGASNFARYSTAAGTWATLTAPLASVNYGGSIAGASVDGVDYIYAFRGTGTTTFWRYNITGNSWETRAVAPAVVSTGGYLLYPGSGDFLYAIPGNGSSAFWRYSLSGNSWEVMTVLPFTCNRQSTLLYPPGTGDFIYCLNSDIGFAKYSITGNTWTELDYTKFPQREYLMACSDANYIYATSSSAWGLNKYNLSTETWDDSSEQTFGYYGGNIVNVGDNVYYFGARTPNDTSLVGFYWFIPKYSISSNKFTEFIKAPFPITFGTKAAYPGAGEYIYVLEGRNTNHFWKLNVTDGTWTQLKDTTYRMSSYNKLTAGGGESGKVYAAKYYGGDGG